MLKMISSNGARASIAAAAAATDVSDINVEDKVGVLAFTCVASWRSFELCRDSLSWCA
jgi:hypothetical protein